MPADHEALLSAHCEAAARQIDHSDRATSAREMSPGDRALFVLWMVDGEIRNGGFPALLFNPTGDFFEHAIPSAHLIGAPNAARLFARLLVLLDVETMPLHLADREALLESLSSSEEAELDRMNEDWYAAASPEIDRRLALYLREHPEHFSAL